METWVAGFGMFKIYILPLLNDIQLLSFIHEFFFSVYIILQNPHFPKCEAFVQLEFWINYSVQWSWKCDYIRFVRLFYCMYISEFYIFCT